MSLRESTILASAVEIGDYIDLDRGFAPVLAVTPRHDNEVIIQNRYNTRCVAGSHHVKILHQVINSRRGSTAPRAGC